MTDSLFQFRHLTVTETPDGIQFSVGAPQDFRSQDIGPEEIARLNEALNRWIAEFTSNA